MPEPLRTPRPRISDVARLAGVSVASVSRVLNDTDVVGDATRAKVLEAVRSLNFSIDQRARALSRQRSETLGIIVADVANPFTAQVLHAIEIVARRAGYNLLLGNSREDAARERDNCEAMLAQRIDGVIILPVTRSGAALRPLLAHDVPVVCLDRYVEDIDLDAVAVDNHAAGAIAAATLIEEGHVRLGVIAAGTTTVGRDRLEGFCAEVERRGVALPAHAIRIGDLTLESGRDHALALCSIADGPTALFVQNHPMALGALLALRELGLRVPQDVSLIAFDDPPWAQLLEPALTTLRQPTDLLGSTAAEMLLERLGNRHDKPTRRLVFTPELVLRRSVGQPNATARHNLRSNPDHCQS